MYVCVCMYGSSQDFFATVGNGAWCRTAECWGNPRQRVEVQRWRRSWGVYVSVRVFLCVCVCVCVCVNSFKTQSTITLWVVHGSYVLIFSLVGALVWRPEHGI